MNTDDNNNTDIIIDDFSKFIDFKNIIGVAKGKKIVNGVETNEDCITFFVRKKLPSSSIVKAQIIPHNHKGYITDVVEVGTITPFSLTDRVRPVKGGYSIGVVGTTAGTAGCAVYSKDDSGQHSYYILSNNHVLANENYAPIGSRILQPGPIDGGTSLNDTIGYLADYEPVRYITKNRIPKNIVDCAICECKLADISDKIHLIGNVKGIGTPVVGMHVKKSGRTTGKTKGQIQYTNASIVVSYSNGEALFTNQIITDYMSEGGDSGSLLLNESNEAIGLLFAGASNLTIFNPINSVLETLNVKILYNIND